MITKTGAQALRTLAAQGGGRVNGRLANAAYKLERDGMVTWVDDITGYRLEAPARAWLAAN
jgi:1,6-anhydro-N-acetylmuramate kinase